jgi:cytochrome c-type biogenesis protein CcmH/NrfF
MISLTKLSLLFGVGKELYKQAVGKAVPLFMACGLFLFVLSTAAFAQAPSDVPLMKLEEVTDLLMSPGCNYTYTLTLCPSAEAAQMREIVKDRLRQGQSKEEILAYFEAVYGPKVLAQPAKRGFFSMAWWFPYFILADVFAVAAVVILLWRKRAREDEGAGGEDAGTALGEDEEAFFEEEVRRFKEE